MKCLFLLIFVCCSGAGTVTAQSAGFGLGVIVGEPTGISAKKWLGHDTALDFAAAWSFQGQNSFTLHADYLLHRFGLIDIEAKRLPVYFGVGGRIKFRDVNDDELGARFPIGVNYHFAGVPLDAFLEAVPILQLLPNTELEFNAALGVRYFF